LGCALSVLQKECRKVWGARYTLGARYWSENTVLIIMWNYENILFEKLRNLLMETSLNFKYIKIFAEEFRFMLTLVTSLIT